MRTLIVIVNYRTADVVCDCLRSLVGQVDGRSSEAVVIDNASPDDSADRIEAACARNEWTWARVIRNDRNAGFGAGNNVGVRVALAMRPQPDLVFLLNPDTVVPVGSLARLTAYMELHPDCGILGCSMLGPTGNLNSNAFRFPSVLSEFEEGARLGLISRLLMRRRVVGPTPSVPSAADWVSGAAMVVRREVWERIGLMDESFFLYFEEVDFCRRAKKAGISVEYLPGVDILHLEGVATNCGHRGGEKRERKRKPKWWYESRRRYFVKHHGWGALLCADALWATGRASLVVRRVIGLGGDTSIDPLRYSADLLGGDVRAAAQALTGLITRRQRVLA